MEEESRWICGRGGEGAGAGAREREKEDQYKEKRGEGEREEEGRRGGEKAGTEEDPVKTEAMIIKTKEFINSSLLLVRA